jgi:DNA-binding winged helix-turn-helix (wHTH) protein/TolB-like protein
MLTSSCFRFGEITVDPRNFKVLKGETVLELEPKAFLLLTFLIDNRDRLVEKRELLDVIWKDATVTENALTREIGRLRKALDDDPKSPKYIQTVHTRGYRFIANLELSDALPEPSPSFSKWYRHRNPQRFFAAFGIVALLIVGTILVRRPAAGTRNPMGWRKVTKLAVLPFRSLGVTDADQYFGLGIADALITKLSNSAQLEVEPISTVQHYADPKRDSVSTGRAMGVDFVLEGKFQKLGERTRFTVQLLCIACKAQSRWAASFDETSGDIFAVQDSISQKVVAALPLEISASEQVRIAKRETSDPQAQLNASKGRFFLNEDTKEGLEKAIQLGKLAVSLDPSFAGAWSVLSDSYRRREWYGAAPAESLPDVRSSAEKAVKLDDSDFYGHSMLGLIAFQYDWDFARAEREYQRAREIVPSWTHQWFARYLLVKHRNAEAESEYQRFLRAARYSVAGRSNYAEFLFLTHQYPRALEEIERTLQLRSDYAPAHELRGLVYEQQGLRDSAKAEFQKAVDLSHGYKGLASLGHLYAVAGQRDKVEETLRALETQRKQRYVGPFEPALIHAGLHENGKALDDLGRAYGESSLSAQSLLFDPRLSEVRDGPPGRAFVRRLGLD